MNIQQFNEIFSAQKPGFDASKYEHQSRANFGPVKSAVLVDGEITYNPLEVQVVTKGSHTPVRTIQRQKFVGEIETTPFTPGVMTEHNNDNPRYRYHWWLDGENLMCEMLSYVNRDKRISEGMEPEIAEFLSRNIYTYVPVPEDEELVDPDVYTCKLGVVFSGGVFTLTNESTIGGEPYMNHPNKIESSIQAVRIDFLENLELNGRPYEMSPMMKGLRNSMTVSFERDVIVDQFLPILCESVVVQLVIGDKSKGEYLYDAYSLQKDGTFNKIEPVSRLKLG